MSLQRLICDIFTPLVHEVNTHDCQMELGRVRGVMLFDTSFDLAQWAIDLQSENEDTFIAALENLDEGIANGIIHVIPQTTGTYNGGEAHTADGYLDGETRLLWHEFNLQFKDPSYWQNKDFWQQAENRAWKLAWRTETLLHISNVNANLQVADPIEEALTSTLTWNVNVVWRSKQIHEILPLGQLSTYFNKEYTDSNTCDPTLTIEQLTVKCAEPTNTATARAETAEMCEEILNE